MKQQYKALMLDLDGTTIPNKSDGMPSQRVIDAIKLASKKIHIGAVTGRPYNTAQKIITTLSLTGPTIAGAGSEIRDAETHSVLWEKPIHPQDKGFIFRVLEESNVPFLLQLKTRNIISTEHNLYTLQEDILAISAHDLEKEVAEQVAEKLKVNPRIAIHKIVGWKQNTIWVQVSHAEATKQHGIWEVAKLLNIETHEIIGVGDGYNDFPLLMACGLKVAMGNAVPELKEIADYIAPSVDEDGVVDVIERFVL